MITCNHKIDVERGWFYCLVKDYEMPEKAEV